MGSEETWAHHQLEGGLKGPGPLGLQSLAYTVGSSEFWSFHLCLFFVFFFLHPPLLEGSKCFSRLAKPALSIPEANSHVKKFNIYIQDYVLGKTVLSLETGYIFPFYDIESYVTDPVSSWALFSRKRERPVGVPTSGSVFPDSDSTRCCPSLPQAQLSSVAGSQVPE